MDCLLKLLIIIYLNTFCFDLFLKVNNKIKHILLSFYSSSSNSSSISNGGIYGCIFNGYSLPSGAL
jgi:hypothetical protein